VEMCEKSDEITSFWAVLLSSVFLSWHYLLVREGKSSETTTMMMMMMMMESCNERVSQWMLTAHKRPY
jgi:hypothetical protein